MRQIHTDAAGVRWTNACALCRERRTVGPDGEFPCPWCKSVYRRWGGYYYPITKENEHLFKGANQ